MAIKYGAGGGGLKKSTTQKKEKAPEPAWMKRYRERQAQLRELQRQREERYSSFQSNREQAQKSYRRQQIAGRAEGSRKTIDWKNRVMRHQGRFDPDYARAASWLGMRYNNQVQTPATMQAQQGLKSLRRPEPMVYGNVPLSRFQQHEWLVSQRGSGEQAAFYEYPTYAETYGTQEPAGDWGNLRGYASYGGGGGRGGSRTYGTPTIPAGTGRTYAQGPQTAYPPRWLQRLVNWSFRG